MELKEEFNLFSPKNYQNFHTHFFLSFFFFSSIILKMHPFLESIDQNSLLVITTVTGEMVDDPVIDEMKREITINSLSDNCLELIFTHINMYEDFNSLKLVSKRWYRLSTETLRRMERLFNKCIDFSWRFIESEHLLSERCSHAFCYHPGDFGIFMFGGCNNSYTAFNDLWFFDLNINEWERVLITRSPLPSPKALATMVLYKGNLLLFGGFSKSSMNPIHQTSTFYNELHLYNRKMNCWEEVVSENTPPHLAGHTASIVGDFMLVFGGSMGSSYNNNVYVLDLIRHIWNMPSIPGPCPPPRYGQSQLLLDDRHLLIVGGCGGPNVNFSDVWLLDFDLQGDEEWRWTQIKVLNPELTPPYMWCHRACKVGTNAVVVSRPIKCDLIRRNGSNRRGLHRRRTSSQSTTSSTGGGSARLTSPDSPSDRRAVAAAFCASSNEEQLQQQVQRKRGNLQREKKPILLTSRSLDDQEQKNSTCGIHASTSYADLQKNENLTVTKPHCSGYLEPSANTQKTGELHRACSIPAIIVGEIPKLIVTSSIESSSNNKSAPPKNQRNECPDKNKAGDSKRPHHQSTPNKAASNRNFTLGESKKALNSSCGNETIDAQATSSGSGGSDALREYYLSLLQEEYNRILITELAQNLGSMNQKLEHFLNISIPYLTKHERDELVNQFLSSIKADGTECKDITKEGSIHDLKQQRPRNLIPKNYQQQQPSAPSSSQSNNQPAVESSAFGPFYGRQMCVYVLRLETVLSEQKVSWQQLPIEEDAPEDRLLHSLVAGRGELILFGGMYSDGNGMDCLNVGMERYTMSSETFILRPRYNEM